MARFSTPSPPARHRLPGRVARARAALYHLVKRDRCGPPVVHDVWPELFGGKAYRPSPMATFSGACTVPGADGPVTVCGLRCGHGDPGVLEGPYAAAEGVSRGC